MRRPKEPYNVAEAEPFMRTYGCIALLAFALSGCFGGSDAPEDLGPVGRIDGAVVDHILRPYAQIQVHLVELDRWTYTTDLGGFSFVNVPVGLHTVEVIIDGVGEDRELLTVNEDDTSRIILQIYNFPPAKPYVAKLVHQARVQLAQPDEVCEPCHWSARLHETPPVLAVVRVAWDPTLVPGVETHLLVQVTDAEGDALLVPLTADDERTDPSGLRILEGAIAGDRLLGNGRIVVDVMFDRRNELPHVDFQLEAHMDLHYGLTDEAAGILADLS